jgi:hypothetical protein
VVGGREGLVTWGFGWVVGVGGCWLAGWVAYLGACEDGWWDDLVGAKGLSRVDEGGEDLAALFAFRW